MPRQYVASAAAVDNASGEGGDLAHRHVERARRRIVLMAGCTLGFVIAATVPVSKRFAPRPKKKS